MIVLVILYRRAVYTKRCLAALSKLEGIRDCAVYFQIDPGYPEVSSLAYQWSLTPSSIFVNRDRLGCNQNVLAGLDRAFGDSDRVLVVEDDIELYPDFLSFATRPEFDLADCVCAYQRHESRPAVIDMGGWEIRQDFGAWGWYSCRDKYEKFRFAIANNKNPDLSWDTALNRRYFSLTPTETVIYPCIGRSFNYGAEEGTFCTSVEDYWKYNYTPWWIGK